jgi:fructose-bisphosphate aldolase class 1
VNTPVPAPQYNADQMIGYLRTAIARKLVPIINLEVYQDGSASPATIEEFKVIKSAIKPSEK